MSSSTLAGATDARAAHRGRAGFTMIELLVAVATVTVLAGIVASRINYDRYRVNAAVRSLSSSLQYAQRQAITFQHDMRVAFDVTGRRLRIHEDANNDNVIDVGERITYVDLPEGIVFGRGTASAMSWGGNAVNFTRTQGSFTIVTFRRDGSASEAGGFYLNSARAVAQSNPNDARAVEVVRSTGRPIWYAYTGSLWQRGE